MENENPSLGSIINDSRKKLGLSQEALAEKANVSLSTIQRVEKGTVKPRSFTIIILAEALELDASELLLDLIDKETPKTYFSALKRINLYTLLFVFIPFINLIIPFVVWKKSKEIHSRDSIAGKLLSFQLLWSIFIIIGMFLSIFLTNVITGEAGFGHYTASILYSLSLVFNVFVIVKSSSQLNNEDRNVLSFLPNLF